MITFVAQGLAWDTAQPFFPRGAGPAYVAASDVHALHRPAGATEVRLYVAVDVETLHQLEERAARSGTDVSHAASDALRAGARAA